MEQYGKENLTGKEKFSNWWYYNWKYAFLAGIALIVIIAGAITMAIRPKYFTSALMGTAGKDLSNESATTLALADKLTEYTGERNAKNLPVQVFVVNYGSEDFSQSSLSWDVQLTAELEGAESQLYIFDSAMYGHLVDQGQFVDLQAAFPGYDIPMQYAVPLSETPLYDIEIPLPKDGLDEGEDPDVFRAEQRKEMDDLYIAFRIDNGKHADRRADQWEILENLLKDTFE